ncbi:TetR/AcrR family transcriptional regulator [Brachybacterium vulturis]|uniref:TetR/AcrR family transcriptional regulator n=1 Tax=Brachybacterium vulturis TaxID=2017484 RepID=UPI003735E3DE
MNDETIPPDQALGLRALKKRQSRIAMHRAALELVHENGLSGVTVEAIAQRAGVSTRTFFNHWTTKESAIIGVLLESGEGVAEKLRERIEGVGPRAALRSVMREALAAAPAEPELRELKKQVMASEPRLHTLSSGNLLSVQTEMVEALADALEGEHAQEQANLSVQIGFAVARSAFAVSMTRGIDLGTAFDEVLDRYDEGASVF